MMTIAQVKIGDRVVWFSPRCEGTVIDCDFCNIQIAWDDGVHTIASKGDGFVGWGVADSTSTADSRAPQSKRGKP
jgi:hypothetical protein